MSWIIVDSLEYLKALPDDRRVIALEEEILREPSGVQKRLSGNRLFQADALMQANRICHEWGDSSILAKEEIPWFDLLAPQIILYILSKLLRIRNLLTRLPVDECWEIRSYHPIIAEMARAMQPLGVLMVTPRSKPREIIRRYFQQNFPLLIAWQRRLRVSPLLGVHGKDRIPVVSNKCEVLLCCHNSVREPVAFNVQEVLSRRGTSALCLSGRSSQKPQTLSESMLRDKLWEKRIHDLQPGLQRALNVIGAKIVSSLGLNTSDAVPVTRLLIAEMQRYFLPQAADAVALAEQALDKLRPRVVVIQDVADFRTRALAYEARKRKIAVVNHQFGAISNSGIEWTWDCADLHLLWGEWSSNIVTDLGVSADKLLLTGTPRLSSARATVDNSTHQSPRLFRALFPLIPASNLDFGNGGALSIAECRSVTELIFRWVELCQEKIILYIKPRPLGDDTWFDSFNADLPSGVEVLSRDYPIDQALSETDLVITTHSAVGIDSIMVGKPLVVIDWGSAPHPFEEAVHIGAAFKAATLETLKKVTEKIFFDESVRREMIYAQEAFRHKIMQCEGQESAEHIAQVLQEVAVQRTFSFSCAEKI